MKNVELLDCTLRDGGRLINCEFDDDMIFDVSSRLNNALIDIVEIGFLRDSNTVNYHGNSTFFTDVEQISRFIPSKKHKKSMFVAFIDYGMFDFSTLSSYDGRSIEGIRFGFTRKNYIENKEAVIDCMHTIKNKGYKLFVQSVNTPGYSDAELLDLVNCINEINPYSYGIVDTYGSMYEDDLEYFYRLIDKNLKPDIRIDFHSHNNFQMSFALSQRIINLSSDSDRRIIIDATLNGMGKGAGNLNLELIMDYLVRKKDYSYDIDSVLDIIDIYLKDIKKVNTWGYSVPGLFSGIYRCHPNNMIYLSEKFDLALKDIKTILSTLVPEKRERYDYDNLQRICSEYINTKVDDTEALVKLKNELAGKTVLLVMPGASIDDYKSAIESKLKESDVELMSVNFAYNIPYTKKKWVFFGSAERYRQFRKEVSADNTSIITSNIQANDMDIMINYEGLVERGHDNFDNSAIMCMNLLKKCEINHLLLAGFDGYNDNAPNYYEKNDIQSDLFLGTSSQINEDIQEMFSHFCKSVIGRINIEFITPSFYQIPNTL